jgi:hypothetical protein
MVYLILTGLYAYVVLKAGLQFATKHKPLSFLQDYRLRFIEIILFTLVLGYTFNYFYFRQTEFNEFIVSRTLLWVSFVASTLMLGIGIGMRFATETLQNFLQKGNELVFRETKEIHDVFSQIWINLSVAFLFFIYCIMEISKAGGSSLSVYEHAIVYTLSTGFGVIYSLQHRDQHPLLRRASLLIFSMLGICLLTFIVESNLNFVNDLPISTSYFLFIVVFVGLTTVQIVHDRRALQAQLAVQQSESASENSTVNTADAIEAVKGEGINNSVASTIATEVDTEETRVDAIAELHDEEIHDDYEKLDLPSLSAHPTASDKADTVSEPALSPEVAYLVSEKISESSASGIHAESNVEEIASPALLHAITDEVNEELADDTGNKENLHADLPEADAIIINEEKTDKELPVVTTPMFLSLKQLKVTNK